jgi:cyclase
MVERVAEHVFIPFTVGGGIRDVETMRAILKAGADKISLNTAAVKNPELIRQGAEMFGAQSIVLAVDVRQTAPNKWEVYTHGGGTATGLDVIEWLKKGKELGAGEILLTSMDRDGTKDGYDCALLAATAQAVDLPIVASGGAGKLEHIGEALQYCSAALLASLLHYKELTIAQIKDYLKKQGMSVK